MVTGEAFRPNRPDRCPARSTPEANDGVTTFEAHKAGGSSPEDESQGCLPHLR